MSPSNFDLFANATPRPRRVLTPLTVSEVNQNTPIIIGHGIKDDIIPIEKSKTAYNQLLEEGANVKFYKYSGGHKISMNYFREILKVING